MIYNLMNVNKNDIEIEKDKWGRVDVEWLIALEEGKWHTSSMKKNNGNAIDTNWVTSNYQNIN